MRAEPSFRFVDDGSLTLIRNPGRKSPAPRVARADFGEDLAAWVERHDLGSLNQPLSTRDRRAS